MFYGYIPLFFNDLSNKFLQNLCKISKSIQNIIIYLYCIYTGVSDVEFSFCIKYIVFSEILSGK